MYIIQIISVYEIVTYLKKFYFTMLMLIGSCVYEYMMSY